MVESSTVQSLNANSAVLPLDSFSTFGEATATANAAGTANTAYLSWYPPCSHVVKAMQGWTDWALIAGYQGPVE